MTLSDPNPGFKVAGFKVTVQAYVTQ